MRDFRYKDDDDDMTDRSQAQARRELVQKPPRLWLGAKRYSSGTGTRTLGSCVKGKYVNHLHHTGAVEIIDLINCFNFVFCIQPLEAWNNKQQANPTGQNK